MINLCKTFLLSFKSRQISKELVTRLKDLQIFRARGKKGGRQAKPKFLNANSTNIVLPSCGQSFNIRSNAYLVSPSSGKSNFTRTFTDEISSSGGKLNVTKPIVSTGRGTGSPIINYYPEPATNEGELSQIFEKQPSCDEGYKKNVSTKVPLGKSKRRVCEQKGDVECPVTRSESYSHQIKVSLINARSIRNKLEELHWWIDVNKSDLTLITETWLTDHESNFHLFNPSLFCVRRDRQKGKKGGGVLCIIRDNWMMTPLQLSPKEPEGIESVWCWCRPRFLPRTVSGFIVAVIYSPPNIAYAAAKQIVEFISLCVDQAKNKYSDAKLIIAGDFNQWDVSGIAKTCGTQQIVNVPTRFDNTLDLIFTDVPAVKVEKFHPLGNGDHDVILAHLDLKTTKKEEIPKTIEINTRPRPNSAIRECGRWLNQIDWTDLFDQDDVCKAEEQLTQKLQEAVETFFPCKIIKKYPRSKPWMTQDVLNLMKKRNQAWKKNDMVTYSLLKERVKCRIKECKKKFIDKVVKPKRYTNPRSWFSHIKKLGGIEKPITKNPSVEIKPDELNDFFINLGSFNNLPPPPRLPVFLPANLPNFLTPLKVAKMLARVKVFKSQPKNDIPNFFIKEFAFLIAEPVSFVFNLSLRQGKIPLRWSTAEIIPLPKVSLPKECNQFRPISKFPVLFRILEKWVADRIRTQVFTGFDENQFGGIPGRSTCHFLINLLEKIYSILDVKGQLATVMSTDMRSAFNRVIHGNIIASLVEENVDTYLVQWTQVFLGACFQFVYMDGHSSATKQLLCGIPQGTSLGPTLFILEMKSCPTRRHIPCKFIDDVAAVTKDTTSKPNGIESQAFFNDMSEWCNTSHMSINANKSFVMHIQFSSKATSEINIPSPILDLAPIPSVSSAKILGVVVHNSLKWDEHVEIIVTKASKLLFVLRKLVFAELDTSALVTAYTCFIRPLLEYATPVWGTNLTAALASKIESVQKRACRIITNDYTHSYEELLERLKLKSMSDRRTDLILKFATKLEKHPIYSNWLQPRCEEITGRCTRSSQKRWKSFAATERRRKSPLFVFSDILNSV